MPVSRSSQIISRLGIMKSAFVPMPGGAAEPVAGAGPMTAGMVAPMGMPPGGDPAAMPPPGMEGMPPPGMEGMPPPGMEGAPPPGMEGMPPMDPAMLEQMAMGAAPPPSGGMITMSFEEFMAYTDLVMNKGRAEGSAGGGDPAAGGGDSASGGGSPAPKKSGTSAMLQDINAKLDAILGPAAAPPMPGAM